MAWLRNGCKENSVLEEQIKKLALHNLVASLSFLPSSYLLAKTSRYQPQYAMSCPMPLLQMRKLSHSEALRSYHTTEKAPGGAEAHRFLPPPIYDPTNKGINFRD